eukprot:7713370-Ditylum_brightwellii.AAC.1
MEGSSPYPSRCDAVRRSHRSDTPGDMQQDLHGTGPTHHAGTTSQPRIHHNCDRTLQDLPHLPSSQA